MSPRLIVLLATLGACGEAPPEPADHVCLDLAEGTFEPLEPPREVYGLGLTYAEHLAETGQTAAAAPPVFAKVFSPTTPTVAIPTAEALRAAMEAREPGLARAVAARETDGVALVDYEAELGVVVRADYRTGSDADVGFFVANDLSERSLAVLGEGRPDRYAYWGASKSHPGFLPTSTEVWIPRTPVADGLPCVRLETTVDGEQRQSQSTADLVYPLSAMLDAVAAENGGTVEAGTWILTGTPSGVALATPAWKVALADLAGLDRFQRLGLVQRGAERFLAAGDEVTVSAEGLGSVTVEIVTSPH